MKKMATVYLLMLAAALPASAQFEVAPDHFTGDRDAIADSTPAADQLRDKIAEQQAKLQACKATLAAREEKVEELRQEAVSAGIQGDGAGPQISAYLGEKHDVEVLRSAITVRIKAAESVIASLQDELAALSAPQHGKAALVSRTRTSHPSGPVLLATRYVSAKSLRPPGAPNAGWLFCF